jgi:hypothetical protein
MELLGGMASSTHVDQDGQIMDKHLLEDSAVRIRGHYLPLLVNHDPDQLVGVILNARLIELPDGEYGLFVISGIFEDDQEVEDFRPGELNTTWTDHEDQLTNIADEAIGSYVPSDETHIQIAEEGLREIGARLGSYLASTQILPDGSILLTKRRVLSYRDLQIEVYPKDHDPPHFHVKSVQREFEARFHLKTLEFLSNKRGSIPNRDIRGIQRYFAETPEDLEKLRREYQRLNPE